MKKQKSPKNNPSPKPSKEDVERAKEKREKIVREQETVKKDEGLSNETVINPNF